MSFSDVWTPGLRVRSLSELQVSLNIGLNIDFSHKMMLLVLSTADKVLTYFKFHCDRNVLQVKEAFGKEDMFFFFEKPSRKIKQIGTVDATINCHMTFKTFPYDVQDCLFEIVPIERTQVEYLKMTTSMVEFSTWPRQFAPTASEFEYKVSEL